MLRAVLLGSPMVVLAVASCGDSSSSFEDIPSDTAGAKSSLAGSASGSQASQAGSSANSGSSGRAGSSASDGGNGNAGNGHGTGGSAAGTNQSGTDNRGGSSSGAGTTNSAGSASQPGTAGQGGSGGQAGATSNAGSPADFAGAGGGMGDGGTGGDGTLCPDVIGDYEIKHEDGTCNGVDTGAPQAIEGSTSACVAHFVSTSPNDDPQGINGVADLDGKGNFKNAKLYLDTTQRSPCSGTWNARQQSMTIECGGPAERCTMLLERK